MGYRGVGILGHVSVGYRGVEIAPILGYGGWVGTIPIPDSVSDASWGIGGGKNTNPDSVSDASWSIGGWGQFQSQIQ